MKVLIVSGIIYVCVTSKLFILHLDKYVCVRMQNLLIKELKEARKLVWEQTILAQRKVILIYKHKNKKNKKKKDKNRLQY